MDLMEKRQNIADFPGVCHCHIRTYDKRVGSPTRALMAAETSVITTWTKPLRGGKITATRRACVRLALLLLRVSSRLPRPPLLPARPIYALKQTVCRRPPASFKSLYPKGRNGLRW